MKRKKKKIGLPPGTVVFTGNRKVEKIQIHYSQYNAESLVEKVLDNHKKIVFPSSPDDKVDWYDIRGIHDSELIEVIGNAFDIHPLILEDVANVYHRPKLEEFEKGIFIVLKALSFNKQEVKIKTEQVSLYLRKGFVATFQETASDLFELVRKRIQTGKGKIRLRGADYLVYALVDVLVDNYFIILEEIEEEIEAIEYRLLESQDSTNKVDIHRLKKELLIVRKSIAPLREAIGRFSKMDNEFVEDSTSIFIRDLYDHIIQIMEMVESFRDLLNGLQDLFMTEVSFRMNQVMQVLTITATIFIPLTFLAGIYGMNFEYMPELHWKYGYFMIWGLMLLIFAGLLFYFKRKKWM